jgi:uncharacterized membrane protein
MPWTIQIVIELTLRLTVKEATISTVVIVGALDIMMAVALWKAVTEHHTAITKIMKEVTRWMAQIARLTLSTPIMKTEIN